MQSNSFLFDADRRANPNSLCRKRGFAAQPPATGNLAKLAHSFTAFRRSAIVRAWLASTRSLVSQYRFQNSKAAVEAVAAENISIGRTVSTRLLRLFPSRWRSVPGRRRESLTALETPNRAP